MKYLKEYKEIKWDFDFDEEDPNTNFNIDDKVIMIDENCCYNILNGNIEKSNRIKKNYVCTVKETIESDNKLLFKCKLHGTMLPFDNWWYIKECFELVNKPEPKYESFDFNEEDFDFEEDAPLEFSYSLFSLLLDAYVDKPDMLKDKENKHFLKRLLNDHPEHYKKWLKEKS